jgi:excisionase family DNA binding protein
VTGIQQKETAPDKVDCVVEKLLFSVREVAQMLGFSRAKVYELLASGQLDSVKIDGSRRIPKQAVEDLIEQARQAS